MKVSGITLLCKEQAAMSIYLFLAEWRTRFKLLLSRMFSLETIQYHLCIEKIFLVDISSFKFCLLLKNLINCYNTVHFMNFASI